MKQMSTTGDVAQSATDPRSVDLPATRREAEKAAAELLQQQLLGPITDLYTARQALGDDSLDRADAEAQRILDEAKARAAEVRSKAREKHDEKQDSYVNAYRAAQERGWTADQLDELGYPKPKRIRRRGSAPARSEGEAAAAPGAPPSVEAYGGLRSGSPAR